MKHGRGTVAISNSDWSGEVWLNVSIAVKSAVRCLSAISVVVALVCGFLWAVPQFFHFKSS